MIILISGVSGIGKTLMAQKLLEKYKIPYLSMDHLKMGLYRGKEDCGFTPLDRTEVIGDKLWPILKGIMMTNIENDQHLIIEGCYIQPHYLKEFETNYSKKMIPVFFGFSRNYIQENFTSKIIKYRNKMERRSTPEERTITELMEEHKEFKAKCADAGIRYFEVKHDYDNEILNIYDYIDAAKRRMES